MYYNRRRIRRLLLVSLKKFSISLRKNFSVSIRKHDTNFCIVKIIRSMSGCLHIRDKAAENISTLVCSYYLAMSTSPVILKVKVQGHSVKKVDVGKRSDYF